MGLFSRNKPKIKVQMTKKDGFSGWLKCTHCDELIHTKELEKNLTCCPKCDYHYRLTASKRIKMLVDEGSFAELFTELRTCDPLQFVDSEPYRKRIARAKEKTGMEEAVVVGTCTVDSHPTALAVMDFSFMGGSMGAVVGERLTLLIEHAIEKSLPVVIVSASGGARMQESTLSLMQMAKTSAALAKLDDYGLPYFSIVTNPTTGGVTASFASLGDIIIAEPNALVAFTGPRVIEQTIGERLPPGAQKSEFLLEHGMIDCIVHRSQLKEKLAGFIGLLTSPQYQVEGSFRRGKGTANGLPEKIRELIAMSISDE